MDYYGNTQLTVYASLCCNGYSCQRRKDEDEVFHAVKISVIAGKAAI
jgi:hypothetical protein